jgi:hypothetical protein
MASYRDVEELLAERGIDVDHVTVYPPEDHGGGVRLVHWYLHYARCLPHWLRRSRGTFPSSSGRERTTEGEWLS